MPSLAFNDQTNGTDQRSIRQYSAQTTTHKNKTNDSIVRSNKKQVHKSSTNSKSDCHHEVELEHEIEEKSTPYQNLHGTDNATNKYSRNIPTNYKNKPQSHFKHAGSSLSNLVQSNAGSITARNIATEQDIVSSTTKQKPCVPVYSFDNELPVRDPGPFNEHSTEPMILNPYSSTQSELRDCSSVHSSNFQLRSQVQELFARHQEDLQLITKSQIDIQLPKSNTSIMASLAKPRSHSATPSGTLQTSSNNNDKLIPPGGRNRTPDVVPVLTSVERDGNQKDRLSTSEFEEPPPRLHFAETPDDLIVVEPMEANSPIPTDPFNFISTIQRKLNLHHTDNSAIKTVDNNSNKFERGQVVDNTQLRLPPNEAEMILSDGPLSTSFASSRVELDSHNKYTSGKHKHETERKLNVGKSNVMGSNNLT